MTLQSDSRVPGRGGEPRTPRMRIGAPPASFGRPMEEEPIEVPAPEQPPSPVRVQDGKVILEVGADLVIGEESSQRFYDQVRSLVEVAFSDGFAAALSRYNGEGDVDEGLDDAAAGAAAQASGEGS